MNSQRDGSWLASHVPTLQATRLFGTGRFDPRSGAPSGAIDMEISAALAADFGILAAALDEPGADLLHSLHQLGVDALAAVPAYLGLSVTVDGSEPPYTFSTFADGAAGNVRTSLRLTPPADVHDGRVAPSVALILYAATPGAFVDLSADLRVVDRASAQRLRARSAPERPRRAGRRDIPAHDVGHESSHRGTHRPRLRSAASTFDSGQRSLWHAHRSKRCRADHSRLARRRGPNPRRAH